MWLNRARKEETNSIDEEPGAPPPSEPKTPLPAEITAEQAAAIKRFGDSIIESLDVSERLRRQQDALERRMQFRVMR